MKSARLTDTAPHRGQLPAATCMLTTLETERPCGHWHLRQAVYTLYPLRILKGVQGIQTTVFLWHEFKLWFCYFSVVLHSIRTFSLYS